MNKSEDYIKGHINGMLCGMLIGIIIPFIFSIIVIERIKNVHQQEVDYLIEKYYENR
jgi:hypothetical protein